jgi:hypothetical protein
VSSCSSQALQKVQINVVPRANPVKDGFVRMKHTLHARNISTPSSNLLWSEPGETARSSPSSAGLLGSFPKRSPADSLKVVDTVGAVDSVDCCSGPDIVISIAEACTRHDEDTHVLLSDRGTNQVYLGNAMVGALGKTKPFSFGEAISLMRSASHLYPGNGSSVSASERSPVALC